MRRPKFPGPGAGGRGAIAWTEIRLPAGLFIHSLIQSRTPIAVDPRREPAIRVTMLPRDMNAHGTIFGGILLAYLDQAGAIATRPTFARVVTVKVTEAEIVYVNVDESRRPSPTSPR